jgi:chromosome segregation ATPase
MKKDASALEHLVDNAISRLEDAEDKMVVCENDVDIVNIQILSVERDIHMLEGSMGNAHGQLEDLGNRVDGFVGSLCTYNNQSTSSHQAWFQEVQRHKQEAHSDHESLLGKFVRNNEIIDKKFVQLDTKLEKVVDLVGEKIKKEVGEIANNFGEVMGIEEAWRASSEVKVTLLEEKLERACEEITRLSGCMVIIQGRVGELQDAVMEDVVDIDDEGAVSTSSSKFDPVENMVVIPIPPPIIHNTLILIEVPADFMPEAFVPPSLRTTPSPPYIKACEEDPIHDGVPEYWVDSSVGQS